MIAYRCSKCKKLREWDEDGKEKVDCLVGIDARPNHRGKGDAELCRKEFEYLEQDERWHEPFSWEK